MSKHTYSYLALGDSYTIGEGVALYESFPCQVVQLLRKKGLHVHAPEIIAKTGWTTFELAEHVLHTHLNVPYDLVTLAIGVNNQYRGLLLKDYENDFEFLLKKALHFNGENPDKVIVLSIPDYSVTPFAREKNTGKIAEEITAFNKANHKITNAYKANYLDITPGSREALKNAKLLTVDELHPSALAYAQWALEVADIVTQKIHIAVK